MKTCLQSTLLYIRFVFTHFSLYKVRYMCFVLFQYMYLSIMYIQKNAQIASDQLIFTKYMKLWLAPRSRKRAFPGSPNPPSASS